jgi:hypothetical protein
LNGVVLQVVFKRYTHTQALGEQVKAAASTGGGGSRGGGGGGALSQNLMNAFQWRGFVGDLGVLSAAPIHFNDRESQLVFVSSQLYRRCSARCCALRILSCALRI